MPNNMKRLSTFLFSLAKALLQLLPLTVFVRIAFLHGAPEPEDWLRAFLAGAALAVLQFAAVCLFSRGRALNRIMVGVNVYLIVGGVAVLANQLAVLTMLNQLRESGIFLSLLAVGVVTTLRSDSGFIGETHGVASARIRQFSLYLLMLTCLATAASFYFRGHLLFSAVLPMMGLAIVNRIFKARLRQMAA